MVFHANPDKVSIIRQVVPRITTISVPFARFGQVKVGGRSTIAQLQTGGLVVFSPVTLTEEIKAHVNGLNGPVSYIVAPDIEHHMNLGPWKQQYPSAKVIAMDGLREKRAKQNNEDVVIDYELNKENKIDYELPADMRDEFDVEYVDAHPNKELVFNHRPTKTLIEADMIWNLPATEQYSRCDESPLTGILTRIGNVVFGPGLGQQRFVWHLMSRANRPSYNASVRRINNWDFDRIIPCHGDVIETGGKEFYRKLFAWHLEQQ